MHGANIDHAVQKLLSTVITGSFQQGPKDRHKDEPQDLRPERPFEAVLVKRGRETDAGDDERAAAVAESG